MQARQGPARPDGRPNSRIFQPLVVYVLATGAVFFLKLHPRPPMFGTYTYVMFAIFY